MLPHLCLNLLYFVICSYVCTRPEFEINVHVCLSVHIRKSYLNLAFSPTSSHLLCWFTAAVRVLDGFVYNFVINTSNINFLDGVRPAQLYVMSLLSISANNTVMFVISCRFFWH